VPQAAVVASGCPHGPTDPEVAGSVDTGAAGIGVTGTGVVGTGAGDAVPTGGANGFSSDSSAGAGVSPGGGTAPARASGGVGW
jgi:hypothetical protein